MTRRSCWLLGNLGGEEQLQPPPDQRSEAERTVIQSLRAVMGPQTLLWDPLGRGESALFDFIDPRPAFSCFEEVAGIVPWLVTPKAELLAKQRGIRLFGPPPALVLSLHDKRFALDQTQRLAADNSPASGLAFALDSVELANDQAALAQIARKVSAWPTRFAENWTLKPRLGCSGRGRLPGSVSALETTPFRSAFRGACRRFVRQQGVIVEPWLSRVLDLSAQYWVSRSGHVQFLGSLRQHVSTSGSFFGHEGKGSRVINPQTGDELRLQAGTEWDPLFHQVSADVVQAAAAVGYFGPCGVDALVFEDAGQQWLRPVVEFNARFTVGHVTLALAAVARRHHAWDEGDSIQFFAGPPKENFDNEPHEFWPFTGGEPTGQSDPNRPNQQALPRLRIVRHSGHKSASRTKLL